MKRITAFFLLAALLCGLLTGCTTEEPPYMPTGDALDDGSADTAPRQDEDQKLTLIDDVIQDKFNPEITVVYFVPDYLKEGGEYQEYTGKVRKVDPIERTVVFLAANGRSAGKTIRVDDITEIHGELVDYMDEV